MQPAQPQVRRAPRQSRQESCGASSCLCLYPSEKRYGVLRVRGQGARSGEIMAFKCNQPAVPTVQQDDATARITRWDFAPGAATGWHTHGWPYFVVMLTDAVIRIEAPDGAVSEARLKAGQSYRRPSGIEHDVMNGSDQPMAFVEIEIKGL